VRAREQAACAREVANLERVIRCERLRFSSDEDAWWFSQLEKLVSGLATFEADEGLGPTPSPLEQDWSVRRRAEFARTLEERSRSGQYASPWTTALASIADPSECPSYAGLRIEPQLGLVPLGRDRQSGLWEFAHVQTGTIPRRDAEGELVIDETSGLVFVLLPGGTFPMGAQATDRDGLNYDPAATVDEGPVRSVSLPAFFLSKYEMTQAQWLRCSGENPSVYSPATYARNWNRERELGSLLHPVENVSWLTCSKVLARLGLVLPSDAQWEYGARAGTTSPWWCGEAQDIAYAGNVADLFAQRNGGGEWSAYGDWDDGQTGHAPVGSYAPNAFGLFDTIGNVNEWSADLYDPSFPDRAVRGGSFGRAPNSARSSNRDFSAPNDADVRIGLRPARSIE
jgi:formylglycine-generating enzyme required for sulfatase activity